MILSDITIKEMLEKGALFISPLSEEQIQPASVDFRLGRTFSYVSHESTRLSMEKEVRYRTIETDRYVMSPGEFVLATTEEYFRLPTYLTAFVEGRSSVGRLGLFVQNAGWVDPGFEGQITLELYNASGKTIVLRSGTRLGQLVFAKTDRPAANPYRGKYQGQTGATGSRMYRDSENETEKKSLTNT